jgi:hypothetical protein
MASSLIAMALWMTSLPSVRRATVMTRFSDMPRSEPCTHQRLSASFSIGP